MQPRLVGEPGEAVFLHGYERTFEVEFACAETDTGVVADPSAVREIRAERDTSSTTPH